MSPRPNFALCRTERGRGRWPSRHQVLNPPTKGNELMGNKPFPVSVNIMSVRAKKGTAHKGESKAKSDQRRAHDADAASLCAPAWFGTVLTPHAKNAKLKPMSHMLSRISLGNNIYVLDNFFTAPECRSWIEYGGTIGFEQIEQAADGEYAHRTNGRIQMFNDGVADYIFKRLEPFLPSSMDGRSGHSCSNNIRLYKYSSGQRFGKHVDDSCLDERSGGESKFTVLIYLCDSSPGSTVLSQCDDGRDDDNCLVGGETVFYNSRDRVLHSVSPAMGRLLLHAQGPRCLTHEGAIVSAGTKYVLRTDVIYK